MLFNSVEFFLFLISVFFLYWFAFSKNLRFQNIFLLLVSYFFYAWWDWRFMLLLLLSTVIDYTFGRIIYTSTKRKKLYLWLSVFNNLIVLFFFKYFNFFAGSAADLAHLMGFRMDPFILNVALPVGISFYTFHGMSYVFDIYNDKAKPIKDFTNYAVFVCFFPLLVAGPIERATHLLPQVTVARKFNYTQAVAGMRLILWGFFKKVVVADTLAKLVDEIFNHYETEPGINLVIGAIFFAFQIYGDFSGYTDIALGTAKLFGFELLSNFRFPYLSRNVAEFWKRWHISLSSWFRDYLYIPLGGSKEGKAKAIRNTFIIFLVSGFWHGANWTFIAWGGLHALFFIPLLISGKTKTFTSEVVAQDRKLPTGKEFLQMLGTFLIVTLAWIFFRAPNISFAFDYIGKIPHKLFAMPGYLQGIPYILVLIILDWLQRRDERNVLQFSSRTVRYAAYFFLACLVVLHFDFVNKTQFIYFQF